MQTLSRFSWLIFSLYLLFQANLNANEQPQPSAENIYRQIASYAQQIQTTLNEIESSSSQQLPSQQWRALAQGIHTSFSLLSNQMNQEFPDKDIAWNAIYEYEEFINSICSYYPELFHCFLSYFTHPKCVLDLVILSAEVEVSGRTSTNGEASADVSVRTDPNDRGFQGEVKGSIERDSNGNTKGTVEASGKWEF